MSHVLIKRKVVCLLVAMALLGANGCRPDFTAATAFVLGYLLGGGDTGQTVSTCFINGAEVDCDTLPENTP